MNPVPGSVRPLLFMLSGPIVWFAHFSLIYAFTALACARDFAQARFAGIGLVPLVIVSATLLAVLALAAIPWLAVRGRAPGAGGDAWPFLRYAAIALMLLALVAVVWEAVAVFFVPACP